MWSRALVFCVLVGVTIAAVGISPLRPKPEKYRDQEGCYVKEMDLVVPFGKAIQSFTQCMEYRCSDQSVTLVSCGVAKAEYPCRVFEDDREPFPDCCPQIICPP